MRIPTLIMLATLTACAASTGDRLVGAWEVDDAEFMRMLREDSSPPWCPSLSELGYRESAPLATDQVVPSGPLVRDAEPAPIIESFHANGSFVQDDGRGQPLVGAWRVEHVHGDTMVVALKTGDMGCESVRTLRFETPDSVRELDGFFGGMMRMKRVAAR